MKRKSSPRQGLREIRNRAFTLIEILTVIVIIAVLFALLLSAIAGMSRNAERVRTKTRAQDFAYAIKEYFNEYGQWPGQTQGASDTTYYANQDVIMNALTNNSRDIAFIELKESAVLNNRYVDSWDQPLIVAMDENADGRVDMNCPAFSPAFVTNIRGTVAVASWGREPTDPDGRVCSWIH